MNETEEIKNRIKMSELVGSYVQLRKTGRNFLGLCPFHNEKTPSFTVSDDKQIFHCFGCGEGGDALTFFQKIEGVDFKDALEILAERAGVKLSREFSNKNNDKNKRLIEINELAARFYRAALVSKTGSSAYKYFKERGLSDKTTERFSLGYSPKSKQLINELLKRGYLASEISDSGIGSHKGGGLTDRFSGRITFPILNSNSKTVAFTARSLGDDMPKYLNSPDSDIYHKNSILYGFDKAKETIRKKDYCLLVEGNMDVIVAHQFGLTQTVGSSGTALSVKQIDLIKRYTKNVRLALDGDKAGVNAAKRAISLFSNSGVNLYLVRYDGKDPAESLLNDEKKFINAVEKPVLAADFIVTELLAGLDTTSSIEKKKIIDELTDFLFLLGDLVERIHYLRLISEKSGVDEKTLREVLNKKIHKIEKSDDVVNAPKYNSDEGYLLELALTSKKPKDYIASHLGSINLTPIFAEAIIEACALKDGDDYGKLKRQLGSGALKVFEIYAMRSDSLRDQEEDVLLMEAMKVVKRMKRSSIKLREKEIKTRLLEAQNQKNKGMIKELMNDFQNALNEERMI